jgi:hypothetical protein
MKLSPVLQHGSAGNFGTCPFSVLFETLSEGLASVAEVMLGCPQAISYIADWSIEVNQVAVPHKNKPWLYARDTKTYAAIPSAVFKPARVHNPT